MLTLTRAASAAILAGLVAASPAWAQTTVVQPTTPPPATVPEKAMPFPVPPDTRVQEPRRSPVAPDPRHPAVSATAGGAAPTDPREYATSSPITVTGSIDGVSRRNGVTSFRLQTPTEAWTVVVPPDQPGKLASGRRVTVVGFPHVEIRNQLLAQSVALGK
ncbi:superantigen-like protein SSL4 [Inquilinus limosus]|uniref:DUF5666 domain-containing protein n=1 Tax=Inquilinus limosus MP06 TaxID=1398085 RepID=A0A0A0D4K5_9PROT|nr:hypothetical protein [Inquilinus limosus]KGM31987.1 hypothetical protein P409_24000 [Inquilinus limosus MP06]